MLRAAGSQLDLPSRRHPSFNEYSKEAKEGQGLIHRARLAIQQISTAELCLLALLVVVCCGVVGLLVANKDIQSRVQPPKLDTLSINSMTQADVQIQRMEHEKAQALAELEPALKRQADLQSDVTIKHTVIDRLHSRIQNLTDLMVQAQYNISHDLPIVAEEAASGKTSNEQTALWEEEITSLKKQAQQEEDAAVKAGGQIESTAREVLSHRQRYQAKAEAAKELRRRRPESNEAKTLVPEQDQQGSSAPVIKTSLDKETGSGADAARSALTDDVASSQQQQASEAESSADAQEAASRSRVKQEEEGTANQQAYGEKRAVLEGQAIDKAEESSQQSSNAAKGTADGEDKTTQQTDEEKVQRLSPAVNLEAPLEDDSVRCRMSGICEGLDACGRGDDLGCIVDLAEKQQKVKEGMQWAWKGYRTYAWGEDELLPHSHQSSRWFGLGLTLIDSLDTLHIMGLEEELGEAREWVGRNLILDQDTTVNLFETTIRILGGLLSAFYLSGGDRVFLFKAVELGMRMTPGFHSPSGIPWSDVNLQSLKGTPPVWSASSSLSEVTSLTMEYFTLGSAMGHPDLGKLAREVIAKIDNSRDCEEGVCPTWVNPHSGVVHGDKLSLGSRGDSYYEYLLKHWILTGKQDKALFKQYTKAMKGIRKLLLVRTSRTPDGLLYVAEKRRGSAAQEPKMDHLVCFLPGVLALGHFHGVNTGGQYEPNDLEIAEELMQTCYEMYRRIPTGLSPEIVFFTQHDKGDDYPKQHHMDVGGGDFMVKQQDSHNLLRPETVESLFVLYQVTGDPQYQDWGWHIFRAFETFSKVTSGGYTNLDSVLSVPPPHRDKMESFWTGEALKYLYLLLDSAPRFPLDQWVFNTEAHPLPVVGSKAEAAVKHQYLSSAEMTHHLSGYRESAHLAEWLQEWQKLDAEYIAQQFPSSSAHQALRRLAALL